jgi:hypothetical protein
MVVCGASLAELSSATGATTNRVHLKDTDNPDTQKVQMPDKTATQLFM